MIATLRIVNNAINNSTSIDVSFTEALTGDLVPANVSILSQTNNVPDSEVLQVSITGNVLSITCQPLTPYAAYYLQFQSTVLHPFESLNGDAKISEDGVSNRLLITGPLPPDNPVNDYLQSFYRNNIYNATDTTTVVNKYIQSIAVNFSRVLYDIRQLGNENYLSFTVADEIHTKSETPFERLYEEAVYDVFRVGFGPTAAPVATTFVFDSFPSYPVTLQRQLATEIIKPSSNDSLGTFNINTLTFNLSNNPVTRVNSITFTLLTPDPVFEYEISRLGYQLLNSTFDQDFASSYLLLENNQVKINEVILSDPKFSLDQIFHIVVEYEYKGLGIQVDPATVNTFATLQSVREVLPPIINIFALKHAPITDASNNTPLVSGVVFIDPNSGTGMPHPAFITEIPFSLSAPPSFPGVYSIDYSTGTVYVYGADSLNDGTGPSPPLATYYYKFTFTPEIDYVYDSDLLELVALPLGNLVTQPGTISFNYEQVLIPGVDYVADSHIESINERVGNRLNALNSLTTLNSPITNVFQIFNETSGEIYLLDRWNNNQVYFRFNSPPRILQETGENSTFFTVTNELLGINTTTTNSSNLRLFAIFLANNTVINSSQDGLGTSFNTSLVFSNGNIFVREIWFNQEFNTSTNVDRLSSVGEYIVDYKHGVVYVAVSSTQDDNIGTVTYKKNSIVPDFPHVVSVDDIYYRISVLNPKNKQFSYTSFGEGEIVPDGLDISDEAFLNGVESSPYQIFQNQVGAFVQSTFVAGVTNAVKFVRSVYEFNDLTNSSSPINFGVVSTSSNFNVAVGSINKQSFESVQFDGSNYFITLNENIPYLSPGIIYTFSVTRISDSQSLWNGSGIIVPGNPLKLVLPGIGAPQVGDLCDVTYSFTIVPLQRVIVDYNKGDFFVDYTYVADEILVSYEYGDNVIDFRKNLTLPTGTNYYVSYKVGALRDALLKNFGTLVNVPDLATFDLSLERERYREALQAALSSFIQGPTVAAIKNIGQIITHVEPEIIESAFEIWSLGSSVLFPIGIDTTGSFQLLPAHYGNGVLVDQPDQTITLPVNSNLRLEEGTFESWVVPQWNGIDNDASLTFTITRDGYAIDPYRVFVGGSEYHPVFSDANSFTLSKSSNITGHPNKNKDGIFIYYDKDVSGSFFRWYVEIIDGYVAPDNHTYQFQISSTGKFYDVKPISPIKPANMSTFTGTSKVSLTIRPTFDGYGIDEGITFVSDVDHFILDFGLTKDSNRLSIFKDVSGYMNFRVYDRDHKMYSVSADVSSWRNNVPHMVAASWKLNTRNNRDEMHLFIDGLEVPNIIKYGQKLQPYLHEKFRTVNPEEIVGLATRDIVGSNDLVTTDGSTIVTSSLNFSDFNISIGDTIHINETGFSPVGYTIVQINGQSLVLSDVMQITMTGGKFSINQTDYSVSSEINIAPNIAVTTIHAFISGIDLNTVAGSAVVTSAGTDFGVLGVKPGFLLRIDNSSFALTYSIIQVNGNALTITDPAPLTLSGAGFQVYSNVENEIPGVRALNPAYDITQDANFNNILTISNDVFLNDLILIRTLGLNFKDIKKQYYVWSSQVENVLQTQLPPPINLDEANITRIITPTVAIGPSNSTLMAGVFVSNYLPTASPSNAQIGRTIQVTISGTNVDFSVPVQVTINGVNEIGNTVNETITFTNYGTLDFTNTFISANYVWVNVKPLNANKNALALELKEKYPITHSESSGFVPVIRYSYHINGGYTLTGNGVDNVVTDPNNTFSGLDINNYLVIHTPASVAGFYLITGLSADRHSLTIQSTAASFPVPLPYFANAIYQVLNTTQYRSGLQNGYFTLEASVLPSQQYFLDQGFYELEYSTYARIKFDALNTKLYIGSDFQGSSQANAVIDQLTIYSIMLTDTRIGEVVALNKHSITKDFNSLKPPKIDANTLVLIDFDSFPFTNDARFYSSTNNDHKHFQSDFTVNDNFSESMVILDEPIIMSNDGILDTRKQGTLEFWMSPLFDTSNDPNTRYYFDAFGAVTETVTSTSNVAVKISAPASRVLNVTLAAGDPKIDYFAGGKLETDTQRAIQEESMTSGTSIVSVSQPILQVMTVKIVGDLTDKDYFADGNIGTDRKTIYLGLPTPQPNVNVVVTYQTTNNNNVTLNTQVIRLNRKLPAQNSKVVVTYIPAGLQGDRFSIFKDPYGYINFVITASGTDYVVRAPTRWARNTWHRVKVSYKLNGGLGNDEMRLFLDGYQYTDVLFGQGLQFGKFPMVYGAVAVGDGYSLIGSISFKDPINTLYIGTDFRKSSPIFTLLDNFRVSNLSRPIYAPYGEPLDANFSNNLSTVFPVTKDLYTTLLIDFDRLNALNTDFTTLVNRATGAFDFTVNIFDSFGIVASSAKVKEVLENLINILKPANSRVFIKYIT
jgi:hypothetical protein